jgi:hypothetical protein
MKEIMRRRRRRRRRRRKLQKCAALDVSEEKSGV